ncbi:hypothetical protein C1752_10478 [Acaryochloris thomasi RCC1774]|uniref:Uncharacterized protein n=1 Tax=Acaryochloris thomasi RCC1774 TaxID=1764569 RepID=A0A2W1J955_9CYAN|nr:hypothetical protein [Acaryochloris thomasi]PZD70628.1 hypothetical protein C1752_10478 [Acaryochloris thomasi RCC1774]
MHSLNLPPQLQSDPENVVSLVTVGQLNSLLESGHITARGAALLCPSSALHLLEIPALMQGARQQLITIEAKEI